MFADQVGFALPVGLTNAERVYENLSSVHGSPSGYTRTDLGLQFVDLFCTFFHRKSSDNCTLLLTSETACALLEPQSLTQIDTVQRGT